MRLKLSFAILLAIFFLDSAALAQETDQDKVFNASYTTLENGMEVVVVPLHRAPVVTHMVWYRVGAADEPPGKSGIAHFLEHLFFKGSEGLEPGEFSRIVRALGGQDNAFTSQDYTAYFQSVPADHLETVMRMEAGRLRGLTLPPEHVEAERNVVLEERAQRTDNNARQRFAEHLRAALFVNHPYGTPVIGWRQEIEQLNRADAKAFYDKWYGPNNAILVVAGDVTPQHVYDLAQKYYAPLPKADLPETRQRPQPPPLDGHVRVTMTDPTVQQPLLQILYRVPSLNQNKEDYLAFQVLEEIMGGGPTSRIYQALVVEQKLATSAGLSYNGMAWDSGTLALYATPAPDTDMAALEIAAFRELAKLIENGLQDTELKDAVTRLQNEAIYARDSLSGPAMIIGYSLASGATLEDVEYWPRDIQQVTAERVIDVARRFLDPNNPGDNPPLRGYLLPEEIPAETPEETPEETRE